MNFILIQLIGAVAYIFLIISYFKKKKDIILFMQIIAYLMFSIHFYLLNGISGAVCNFIGLIALVIIYIFDKYKIKNKELFAIIFIISLIIINIITYQNIYSILPVIALSVVIISFLINRENVIRIFGLVSTLCWLIYGVVYKSYISIIFQILVIISTCISLVSNKIKK